MNVRLAAAVAAIVVIVAVVYVFSIVPYLVSAAEGRPPGQISLGLEMIIPAAAIPLILVLLFLVPPRRTVESIDMDSGKRVSVTKPQSYEQIGKKRFKARSLLAGSIGGLVAASILAGLVFVGDLAMGLPVGTFYSIIALAIAGILQPQLAIYLGLAMHLLAGTAIGGIFGFLSAAIGPFNITSLTKGAGVGVLAGFISFSLLFIPITRFEVEPALTGILLQSGVVESNNPAALESRTTDIMSSVLAFSILFHIVYGAIMGSIAAILIDRLPALRKVGSLKEPKDREGKAEGDFSEAA